MICDFCGYKLPILVASNNRDALFDSAERIETEQGSHLCLDLNDYCIYEFWRTESVQPVDRYKHLCKKCASRLDAFGSALLVRENHRRIMNYRNISANALNAMCGKEMHPYMVAVDLGIKDHPRRPGVQKRRRSVGSDQYDPRRCCRTPAEVYGGAY